MTAGVLVAELENRRRAVVATRISSRARAERLAAVDEWMTWAELEFTAARANAFGPDVEHLPPLRTGP